jgi:predicted ATPase
LRYGQDPGAAALSHSSRTLWLLGYPDQAQQRMDEALALARELSHPFSQAYTLINAIHCHEFRREMSAVQEKAEALMTLSVEHGFAGMLAHATLARGWVLSAQGQVEQGIAQMQQVMAARTREFLLARPYDLALLAELHGRIGQAERRLPMLAEALDLVEKDGMNYFLGAELHRVKGELLLQLALPDEEQAETCFHQALEVARHQHAKSLELRAATNLARLWQSQGKRQDASALLAPVYNWFTEGFDTADLQEAKGLLDELA